MADKDRKLLESMVEIENIEQLCSSLDVAQLAERLERFGILSGDEFTSIVEELKSTGETVDATLVADALVRAKRVSFYQLWAAVTGESQRLSLGEYLVVEPLGAGGMGEVLLAVHRRMKRQVAIKFLPSHFANDEEMIKRFEREVEVAAQLSHPNIVTSFDAGRTEETHFLVMEYVDGCDLRTLIHNSGPLPLDDALKCALQAGKGIAHAHGKGVIHRDIKPSNLLADRQDTIKVLDMGLARWSNTAAEASASDLSVTGSVMGTVDFMAPEQAISAKSADHRADIYSLGCTLYMLVHGVPVFAGDTVVEKIMAHQGGEIPDLVAQGDDKSVRLNRVFRRMLAKKPEDRFESMEEACEALTECLANPAQGLRVELPIPARVPVRRFALQDTKNRRPEASFVSTVNLTDEKEAALAAASPTTGSWWRAGSITIVLLLLAGGAFFGGPIILRLMTPDGTLIVKCYVEGAVVEIDGQRKIRVTDPDTQDEYRFDLPKGEHRVRVVLPDGTEIKSGTVEVKSKSESLFEVLREANPRGPPVSEVNDPPAPAVDDDPNVLTVAQDGSADYESIGAAVAAASRGNIIRIVDDATYRESVVLNSREKHIGLTIEATGNSKWVAPVRAGGALIGPATGRALLVPNVNEVTLRSLHIETQDPASFGVVLGGAVGGCRIENCRFTSATAGLPLVSLEGIQVADDLPPVVVTGCVFNGLRNGMQISGSTGGAPFPLSRKCGEILIQNNLFESCQYSLALIGHIQNVWVVGNTVVFAGQTGFQTLNLLEDIRNVCFANNTFFESRESFRIWEDGFRPADVSVLANVSLGDTEDRWLAYDSGGNPDFAQGPGDGQRFASTWTFAHNYRQDLSPGVDPDIVRSWIPLSKTSVVTDSIEVLSRDRGTEGFLRPAPDSPLAKGGLGGELPVYAGAVPPVGNEPFDWERAFKRSLVLSRVPADVITHGE